MTAGRRRAAVVGGVAAVALVTFVGTRLIGREKPYDPCPPPVAAPAAQLALLPPGLTFEEIGTVTRVRRDARNLMVRAVTQKPLNEATINNQDAVVAAGYRPAGMDNEGFEAEVFFTTGPYAAGMARVRRCRTRWDIDLVLLNRDALRPSTTRTTTVP